MLLAVVALATCVSGGRYVDGSPLRGFDWPVILPHLRTADLREALGWWAGDWVQHNGYYRPIPSCSFWLDYRIAGESHPAWWRIHNVLLMAVVSCLLATFVRLLTESRVAGLVAGLFATSGPVAGRIVGHVSPRTDVMCALFLLAALIFSLRWLRTGRRRDLLGAALMAALSGCSKETGVLLAFLLPLVLWSVRAPLRRAAVLSGVVIAVLAGCWLLRSAALHMSPLDLRPPVRQFPAQSRLGVFLDVVLPVYRDRFFYRSVSAIAFLTPWPWLVVLADLIALAQWAFTGLFRPRLLVLGVLWKAITVWPVLGYLLIARHYHYIPDLGDGLLYGCAAAYVWSRIRKHLRREPAPSEGDLSERV